MKYKLCVLIAVLGFSVLFTGCMENKRKPDKIIKNSRQLAKIYGDSLAFLSANLITTVYITDSLGNSYKVDITREKMDNIIKLLRMAIDFNYTDRIDEILRMDNLEAVEKALMNEMDRIAIECHFVNFTNAGKIIDKLKDYPEISVLLQKLSEIEKTKFK